MTEKRDLLVERDLNTLVAETVMGLTVIRNKKGGWSIGEADWQDFSGDMQLANPLPDYCNDIASAMEVFEHLRNSHDWCCLKIDSDYMYQWSVSLTPGYTHRLDNDPHIAVIHVSDESLPRAICHLALRSVKWLKENKKDEQNK